MAKSIFWSEELVRLCQVEEPATASLPASRAINVAAYFPEVKGDPGCADCEGCGMVLVSGNPLIFRRCRCVTEAKA